MITMTTKTPRTDSEALWPSSNDDSDKMDPNGGYVSADFAREMEKILHETLSQLKEVVEFGPNNKDEIYDKAIKRAEDFLGKN